MPDAYGFLPGLLNPVGTGVSFATSAGGYYGAQALGYSEETALRAMQVGDMVGAFGGAGLRAGREAGLAGAWQATRVNVAATVVGLTYSAVTGADPLLAINRALTMANAIQSGRELWLRACFAAGTPVETLDGHKLVEEVRAGDRLLARPEEDPDGRVEEKEVQEVFVRVAPVVNLHVGGRVIRTTAEHPFWVKGKGWTAAGLLEPGQLLRGRAAGEWVAVEAVTDSGEVTTVYNFAVAEYHTYFVGSEEWGFSVWAHNSYTALRNEGLTKSQAKRANMLYKTQGEAAARTYLEGQGFSSSRLDTLVNAAGQARTGAQRGPNDTSGHSATIRRVASEVTANGDTVLAGGKSFDGVYRREAEFATPGGFRDSRRPDILVRRPDGSIYGINVGQTEASGLPVLRERLAIQDLNEQRGLEMRFVSHGRRQ